MSIRLRAAAGDGDDAQVVIGGLVAADLTITSTILLSDVLSLLVAHTNGSGVVKGVRREPGWRRRSDPNQCC